MKRKVFYSFHYKPDYWRVGQVRNVGMIEDNKPATDNDWETVTKGGDKAIKKWIAEQMHGRSCTLVLVGTNTANRKWINHEIVKSWDKGMGVAGIRIHGLKNKDKNTSSKGSNPFSFITYGDSEKKLSSIVKCYDSPGRNSQEKYNWIADNLAAIVEEAIKIRQQIRQQN